jgi:AraC-like DNA-binding protein
VFDTLSDVLRSMRLAGAVFIDLDTSEPWRAAAPAAGALAPHLTAGVEHVIGYHVVTHGSCWGGLRGEPAVELRAGDVLVLPHGDAHLLSSSAALPRMPEPTPLRASVHARLPLRISIHAGHAQPARVICGFLGCQARPFEPLLAGLPRLIHLSGGDQSGAVRQRLVERAALESATGGAGSQRALACLGELLLVDVVRQHLADAPPGDLGWLAGLRDDAVGRALQQLHERPAHAWSLEELRKQVGMSRSALAERFAHFVGVPPIQYLAQWRIQLAASLLRSGKSSLAEIADRVGYGSEAALSRAFKRRIGVAPTPYRRLDALESRTSN